MMKPILLSISLLTSLAIFSACELDYAPQNTMVDETVYKDEKTSQAALMGAYTRLCVLLAGAPNDQNNYTNSYFAFQLADIGTENITVQNGASSFLAMEKCEYTTDEHDGFIKDIYQYGYNAIDYANNIIAGINEFGQYDPKMMKQHIAEAKFLRAYEYFTLLCLYGDGALVGEDNGLGLVMRLSPYDGYKPEDIQARETVGNTYAQIIKDLTEAIPDLPQTDYTPALRYRATASVAKALLSRVYLYKGTYTKNLTELGQAAYYAGEVLKSPDITFNDAYNDHRTNIFPSNVYENSTYPDPTNYATELIFFQPSRISTNVFPCGWTSVFSKDNFSTSDSLINSYLPGDLRGYGETNEYLIQQGSSTSNTNLKASMKYDNGGCYCDVQYIRLSEIMLTRAEALAYTTNSIDAEALELLNDIRRKPFPDGQKPAELTAEDFPSVEAFVDSILVERNRELAMEGHYRWDLIRTGRDLKVKGLPNNKKILPIPEYEVQISDGVIKQNTGF